MHYPSAISKSTQAAFYGCILSSTRDVKTPSQLMKVRIKEQQEEKQFRIIIYDLHPPLIIRIDLLIGKSWPSHVLLTACSVGLLGGDTCCWHECTADVINPVWEALRNLRNPNLLSKISLSAVSIRLHPPCSHILQQYLSTLTLCIRLTLYYVTHDACSTYINRTGTQGVRLSFLQGQEPNLIKLIHAESEIVPIPSLSSNGTWVQR